MNLGLCKFNYKTNECLFLSCYTYVLCHWNKFDQGHPAFCRAIPQAIRRITCCCCYATCTRILLHCWDKNPEVHMMALRQLNRLYLICFPLNFSEKCMSAKSLSHDWLFNPMGCSLSGSSVHGIFQARILEWVTTSFSRGSSQPRYQTYISYVSYTGSLPLNHLEELSEKYFP